MHTVGDGADARGQLPQVVGGFARRAEELLERPFLLQPLLEGLEVLAQDGDALADVVVQFAGHAGALLLHGRYLPRRVGGHRAHQLALGDDDRCADRHYENARHRGCGGIEDPELDGLIGHRIPR